jgi:uncharacterized protein
MSFKSSAKVSIGFRILVLAFLVAAISGCSKPQIEKSSNPDAGNLILRERLAKDQAFKSDQDSPIPEKDRPGFHGLSYYPFNPNLRYSVALHRYPAPEHLKLSSNSGEIRRALRYGYFEFQVGSTNCRLQVYRLEDSPENGASLFIPFRDSTSGQETYAAGRYIDLTENTSGIYELDFNRAYNPYCAYNSTFSCPYPPAENKLNAPIRAGEKTYLSGPAH